MGAAEDAESKVAVGMKPNPFGPCPARPELDRLIKEAIARFDALPPEQQREHRRAQRKSWMVGEMMLEHPEMTREQAAEIYDGLTV